MDPAAFWVKGRVRATLAESSFAVWRRETAPFALLRKRPGTGGGIRSLSRDFSSIERAEAGMAFAAAVFPSADEQKHEHLYSRGILY